MENFNLLLGAQNFCCVFVFLRKECEQFFFPTTFLVIMRRAVHQIIKIYVCQVLLKNRHQLVPEYFRKSGQKFSFEDGLQKWICRLWLHERIVRAWLLKGFCSGITDAALMSNIPKFCSMCGSAWPKMETGWKEGAVPCFIWGAARVGWNGVKEEVGAGRGIRGVYVRVCVSVYTKYIERRMSNKVGGKG